MDQAIPRWRCPLAPWVVLTLFFLGPAHAATALAPSVLGDDLEQLWTHFYHRSLPQDTLIQGIERLWPRTLDLDPLGRLREQTHLRFFQGMVEQDRKDFKAGEVFLAEAEKLWRQWLALEPRNGRTRLVGVEIRTMRMYGRGWLYAVANILSLDADLAQALRDSPGDLRVRTVAAMKYHHLPRAIGGNLSRAIELLEAIPPATDPKDAFLRVYELSVCHRELGNKVKAQAWAQEALKIYLQSWMAQEAYDAAQALPGTP